MTQPEFDHLPISYRPEGVDRFMAPADVCGTCSDFESGRLVPVSFCPEAKIKSDELYAYIHGDGPEPAWG
jgi:hypothetical protein